MPKYNLPCPCGDYVVIEPRQAGQTVNCSSCGESLEVPKFREISKLEPAERKTEKKPADKAAWSPVQGGLFVGGIVCVLVGLGIASYFFWESSKYNAERPTLDQIYYTPESNERLEQAGGVEMLAIWDEVTRDGLVRTGKPGWLQAQEIMQTYQIVGGIGAFIALAGASMTGASVFLRK